MEGQEADSQGQHIMTTFDCLGEGLAWTLTLERFAIVALYLFITERWLLAAKSHIGDSARLWRSLAWLFRLCAICGYGLPALAGWWPMTAYYAEVVALPILAGICLVFLWYSRGKILIADHPEALLSRAIKSQTQETNESISDLKTFDDAKKLVDRITRDKR